MVGRGRSATKVSALIEELGKDGRSDSLAAEVARIESAYARRLQKQAIYSLSEPSYRLLTQERERKLRRALSARGISNFTDIKLLDIGCGSGAWLRDFIRWGARPENLCGVDL